MKALGGPYGRLGPVVEKPRRFRFGLAKLLLAVSAFAVAFWLSTSSFARMMVLIVVSTLSALTAIVRVAFAPAPEEEPCFGQKGYESRAISLRKLPLFCCGFTDSRRLASL